MKKYLFIALAVAVLLPARAFTQTTDCFSLTCGNGSGQPGEVVCLPLTVEQFSEVVSMQFSVRWNPTLLEFQELQLGALPGVSTTDFNVQPSAGVFNFVWYNAPVQGVTLAGGSALFNLCFKIIGQPGDFSPVFLSNSPVFIEIMNASGQVLSPNFVQGGIAGLAAGQQAGSPILMKACVKNMDCTGPYGAIDLSVFGGEPPFSILWTGPNGFLKTTEDLTGLLPGLYKTIITDAAGLTQKGDFFIESILNPGFSVELTAIPATCPVKNDGQVLLETMGAGAGFFTYLWSNGATGQNLTGIVPGDYSVSVMDAAGCQVSQKIVVGELPGFSTELVFDQPNCLTNDSLGGILAIPTATTGAAPFGFLWSTGATGAEITGIAPGSYQVTVTEAGGCTEVVSGAVSDDLLVDWTVSLATNCATDTMLGTVEASLFLNSGGAAPFLFEWSNGFSESITPAVGDFPKSSITTPLSGIYELKISDSNGCDFTKKDILLDCDLPFNAKISCFSIQGLAVPAPDTGVVCVEFVSLNMDSLVGMQFGLEWDTTKLVFDHAATLADGAFLWNPADPGFLRFAWLTTLPGLTGVSAVDGTVIIETCFLPKGAAGEVAEVMLTERPIFPIEIIRTNYFLPFNGQNARIKFGPAAPADLRLEACTIHPDCATDGLSGIDLSVTGGTTPYIYDWVGGNFSATTQDISQLLTGIYDLTVTDATGSSATAHFAINPVNGASIDCVWPGDADDNASANHFDLLTIGLGMGINGPARTASGLLWTGYAANIWGGSTPLSMVNFRNLDADGNGSIEPADAVALIANWGETIFPTAADPNLQLPDNQSVGAQNGQSGLFITTDTLEAGEAAAVPILLGLPGAPVVDILGVAFSLFYDTALVKEASVSFQPTSSWLGTAGADLVFVQKNFPEKGRLDVALTRTDGQNLTGFGEVGLAYIVIEDDIYFRDGHGLGEGSRGPTDTVVPVNFTIRNIRGITANERVLDLQPKDAPFFLHQKTVGTDVPVGDIFKKIIAFPNPVFGEINLESSIFMESLAIFGADGRFFLQKEIGSRSAVFSMDGLPGGFYFIKIQTSEGVVVKKVFKK